MKMFRYFRTIWVEWKHRNIDPDLCCCGSIMSDNPYYECGAACRSVKEYIITSELNKE